MGSTVLFQDQAMVVRNVNCFFTRKRDILGTKESRGDGNSHELTEILGDWKEKNLWVRAIENNLFFPASLMESNDALFNIL